MTVAEAEPGMEYHVKEILSEDEELKKFLFSLGCYVGEPVTIIARKKNNLVLSIKDARYNVDIDLARTIEILQQKI